MARPTGSPPIPLWWPEPTRRFIAQQYAIKKARAKRMPPLIGGRPVGDTAPPTGGARSF
jgi:hypothetical protein